MVLSAQDAQDPVRRRFRLAYTRRSAGIRQPRDGSTKTEIVFFGDTVNTAARVQELCRQTGDRILASAALIDRR
jgi:class 3 adenylate cyclase